MSCKEFDLQALPGLVDRYVRPGKLRIELRPIDFVGPDSERGRTAVIAASRQDRMFDFTELLYFNQGMENTGWLDDGLVEAAAASVPRLDLRLLLHERGAAVVGGQVRLFDEQARIQNVDSTPTILVGRSGGPFRLVELASPSDGASVAAAIDAVLLRVAVQ
jgi:protein-disulfide isomerase